MELYKKPNRTVYAPSCPCGKSNKDGKFVPFLIDGVPSSQYGYCHSCGETFHPKGSKRIEQHLFTPPKCEFKTISKEIFETTLNHFGTNNFVVWLNQTFADKAQNSIAKYNVGTRNKNETIFWYIDFNQKIRTAKVILYNTDGKRNKRIAPRLLFTRENGYTLCLFGEHLLNKDNYDKSIMLVESEKTAIVGSIVFPQFIWLATGGANSLTKHKAQVLKYRKVIIIPDCDEAGRKGATRNLEILSDIKCNVSISNMGFDLNNGEDLVDLVIQTL